MDIWIYGRNGQRLIYGGYGGDYGDYGIDYGDYDEMEIMDWTGIGLI